MNDHLFVDTNVLVYFRDASEPEKQHLAKTWLRAIWEKKLGRLSYQVLNEYYVTVTRKLDPGLDVQAARLDVKNLMAWDPIVIEKSVVESGWYIQDQYPLDH
jgi:predicted nucleic acid-binding protein